MEEQGVTREELIRRTRLSSATIAKLRKDPCGQVHNTSEQVAANALGLRREDVFWDDFDLDE